MPIFLTVHVWNPGSLQNHGKRAESFGQGMNEQLKTVLAGEFGQREIGEGSSGWVTKNQPEISNLKVKIFPFGDNWWFHSEPTQRATYLFQHNPKVPSLMERRLEAYRNFVSSWLFHLLRRKLGPQGLYKNYVTYIYMYFFLHEEIEAQGLILDVDSPKSTLLFSVNGRGFLSFSLYPQSDRKEGTHLRSIMSACEKWWQGCLPLWRCNRPHAMMCMRDRSQF